MCGRDMRLGASPKAVRTPCQAASPEGMQQEHGRRLATLVKPCLLNPKSVTLAEPARRRLLQLLRCRSRDRREALPHKPGVVVHMGVWNIPDARQ